MNLKKCIVFTIFFINIYSKNILVLSIPKCGTHLLSKCITLLTNKKLLPEVSQADLLENKLPEIGNNFIRCHLTYSKQICNKLTQNFLLFFIYRDPRDQIISQAYWIQKRLNSKYNENEKYKIPPINEIIDKLIINVTKYYSKYIPWIYNENICSLKFEELIGPIGLGDLSIQYYTIKKIINFLNEDTDLFKLSYCMSNLYGKTFTFREGKIGEWKKIFDQRQKKAFKHHAGNLLIKLGYEKDLNW